MATRATEQSKQEKAAWASETIAEWKQSKSVTWRAQKSTSPEGDEFIGIRQYVKTATKGEIAGKGGITFKVQASTVDDLGEIIRCLRDARTSLQDDGSVKGKGIKKAAQPALPTNITKPMYQLVKGDLDSDSCRYLKSAATDAIKITSDKARGQLFTKPRAQALLNSRLSQDWSILRYVE